MERSGVHFGKDHFLDVPQKMRFGKPKHLKMSKKIPDFHSFFKKKGALFEFEGHGYPLSETNISPLKVVSKICA